MNLIAIPIFLQSQVTFLVCLRNPVRIMKDITVIGTSFYGLKESFRGCKRTIFKYFEGIAQTILMPKDIIGLFNRNIIDNGVFNSLDQGTFHIAYPAITKQAVSRLMRAVGTGQV